MDPDGHWPRRGDEGRLVDDRTARRGEERRRRKEETKKGKEEGFEWSIFSRAFLYLQSQLHLPFILTCPLTVGHD